MASEAEQKLQLEVGDVRAEARDVILIELRRQDGSALPAFEPGAHLEVSLPNGLVRHYSLSNDNTERNRYVIGVGRAADSRGGSAFLHQSLRCGDRLSVSVPRNNFRLDPDAGAYCFVAGGIGITPVMAMIRWCVANQRPWRLIYATRSRQRAAFYEELRQYPDVTFHFDDEAGNVLAVPAVLSDISPGEQIYCCGPEPLMNAVESATSNLPPGTVRFEYFTAPEQTDQSAAAEGAFRIELKRSGGSLEVPADKSILEVLEANGHERPFSCREGLCRTCEVMVCEGDPDHRDYVLSEEEQAAGASMMICVSRAKSPVLVLDL